MKKILSIALLATLSTTLYSSDASALEKGSITCEIPETGIGTVECRYEEDNQANRFIRGTVLWSANSENSSVRWNPGIDELPNLVARLFEGSNTIVSPDVLNEMSSEINNTPLESDAQLQLPESADDPNASELTNDPYQKLDTDTYVNLPNLVNNLANVDTNRITLINTEGFKSNEAPRAPDVPVSRAHSILGSDILLTTESYNMATNDYKYTEMVSGKITNYNAIMALYKSLDSKVKYKIQHKFYSGHNTKPTILVTGTHFIGDVSLEDVAVYSDTYWSKIFVSRTVPETYWTDALNAKIVQPWDKRKTITLGEFAVLLREVLDLNGEEVLNKTEEDILVAVYGKDLPYYLPSTQVDAVRYLIARGIATPDMKFSENLTTSDMLDLLMRAKDPNSRLDFKNIDFEYSEELLSMGYYPTQIHNSQSPMTNLRVITPKATATHYDYLVRVIPDVDTDASTMNKIHNSFYTIKSDGTKKGLDKLYVSSSPNQPSDVPLEGSAYLGTVTIEGIDYYHFQVPVSYTQEYVSFTAGPDSENYKVIKLPVGGGLYYEASLEEGNIKMNRIPLQSDVSSVYIDRERKLDAMENLQVAIQLNAQKTRFLFNSTVEGIATLLWKGKPITEADGYKDNKDGTYEIEVSGADPYKTLTLNLSYNKRLNSSEMVPAYVKDNKYALVSVNWLKMNNIIHDIVSFEDGKHYVLYSKNQNISIDLENRVIVSGQAISEVISTDESPLVVVDPTSKDILIDYRAVAGLANDYLVVRDVNGHITLSTPPSKSSDEKKDTCVGNLTGNSCTNLNMVTRDGVKHLALEETYPLSNYFIYRSRSGSVREDYFVLAKPLVGAPDNVMSAKAKEMFGLVFDDNVDVDIYRIGSNILTDSSASEDTTYLPSIVFDADLQEYYYKLPYFEDVSLVRQYFKNYMTPEQNPAYALPLVLMYNKVIDMNINIIDGNTDMATYPSKLQNRHFTSKFFEGTTSPKLNSMELAITGITSLYYPYGQYSWLDVSGRGKTAYLGSMPVVIQNEDHEDLTNYLEIVSLNDTSYRLVTVHKDEANSQKFTEIFRGTTSSIYSYGVKDSFKIDGFDDIEPTGWDKFTSIISYSAKNTFDFIKSLKDFNLRDVDDLLTISIMFMLNIIPRILLFWFFAYAVLGLIHDWPLIHTLCAKTIDIYKVMSLGIRDVSTYNRRDVWLSTFIGIVLLAMMNGGIILDWIAWVTKSLIDLSNR